jgi:hypothetical protein
MACKPREEMLMQGIREEEDVLVGALIEVGVANVSIEYLTPNFIGSYSRGFCDLGMEEEEETKCAELAVNLEPASAGRYLLMV